MPASLIPDAIEAARRTGLAAANAVLVRELVVASDPALRDRLYAQLGANCASLGVRTPDLAVFGAKRAERSR